MYGLLFTFLVIINSILNGCNCQMHWEKLFDSLSYKLSSKPAPRREAAIGHDREKNRIVIFGGWQTNSDNLDAFTKYTMPVLFDDTWEYNLETKIWRPLSFSLIRPQARYGMLYTHNKHGLYISCGRGWLDEYFNDLWIYDFSDDQWRKMDQTFISIMPEPRYATVGGIYPSYEYNSDEKNNLYLAMGRSQYYMYNNMYAFTFTDLRAVNGIWDMIYTDILTGPYSFTSPHGRTFASSAVISPDELLIHGGCLSGGLSGGPCPSFDSWIYSYSKNKWEKIDSSCISPRSFSSMASLVSDGFRQSAVMFSGFEKDSTILKTDHEREEEVALYDSLARKWVKKRVQGFYFPEKRNGHVMCTGKLNNDYGVFMFGGYGHFSDTNLADLWFLRVNISSAFDNPTLTSFYPIGDSNDRYFINLCCSYFTTIHVHAILMFAGWAIFINVGTLIVNYADKDQDDDGYESRHKFVVKTYHVLQFFGLLFITGGIVFGIWSAHGIPHLAHALIGISAYLLAVIKPISSYLRRQTKKFDYYLDEEEKLKAEEYKLTWCYSFLKIIHKNLSRTAILLALINISLGVFLAVFEWYWIVIWFIYLGLFVCIYIILEARKQSNKKSKLNDENSDNLNNNNVNNSSLNTNKLDLTKSNMSLNKLDDYEDGYEMNISKTDSTQQLRPNINENPNLNDGRLINKNKTDNVRYTPSSQLITKANAGGLGTIKQSPITPPPPYFNRNKNSISTIELDSYTIKTSSPKSTISRKTPSQAHLLQNNINQEIDDELPIEEYQQQNTSFSNISTNKNINNVSKPQAVTPTPRKIYQTMNNNNNNINNPVINTNNTNNKSPVYTIAQHTKSTLLNDNILNNNNNNNSNMRINQQNQSFNSNPNSQQNSMRQNSGNYLQQRTILSNQNIIKHINSNILNPVNNPNNYRY